MAIRYNDKLQKIFSGWIVDDRVTNWLWLVLQDNGAEFDVEDFGTLGMRDRMADYLNSRRRLICEIEDTQSRAFVPERDLQWIEKFGRQPAWLLKKYLQGQRNSVLRYFVGLTEKQKLVLLLDYLDKAIFEKKRILDRLQMAWVQQQVDDRHFDWYDSGGKENEKCKIAWKWYQINHQWAARHALEFVGKKDVLTFLDSTNFDLDAKLYHLGQIKRKFKAEQTKANRQGKTQTNLSLSEHAREQLDELAKREGKTKTELIELLIHNAYEHCVSN
ncbi:CopG family transcriptional regulator [Alcaligenes faecalis]|uniref:ribbon-helix-helix domain-containing protein n=1 Tax=Alcaligenes faecalis TaxID=511 RepID=UPI0018EEF552|nr:CopG family transcriptional regulator [Alcaligenes faecalis]